MRSCRTAFLFNCAANPLSAVRYSNNTVPPKSRTISCVVWRMLRSRVFCLKTTMYCPAIASGAFTPNNGARCEAVGCACAGGGDADAIVKTRRPMPAKIASTDDLDMMPSYVRQIGNRVCSYSISANALHVNITFVLQVNQSRQEGDGHGFSVEVNFLNDAFDGGE